MTAAASPAVSPTRAARWLFFGCLASIAVCFFLAAKFLPAVDTHASSFAAVAGYTNQLAPLVAILIAGATLLGVLAIKGGLPNSLEADGPTAAVPYWRWQVLAAAGICVAVVVLVPTWSQPNGYFGMRVAMMAAGKQPYVDFEYAYGALVAYLPYALHAAGLSIKTALELSLSLAAVIGVGAFAVVTARWLADPRLRVLLFWTLAACEAFVDPGPSLNYNFARYALPFALLIVLARAAPRLGMLARFGAIGAANTLVYLISPEMGCAFSAAMLAWIVAAARFTAWPKTAAGVAAVAVSVGGLLVFAGPMFSTLEAYGQSQVLMPVVPNLIMTLFVVSFLIVGAFAAATAWALWRGRPPLVLAPPAAEMVGCVALCAALAPAVIGRSWPTITIAYGFAPIVLLIGRLIVWRASKTAAALAVLFGLFVAYSAWSGVGADVGRLRAACRAPICARRGGRDDLAVSRAQPPPMLTGRHRGAYDPLGLVYPAIPPVTDVGYYPGLRSGDVTTEAAVARKLGELRRAPFYVIPARRDFATAAEGPPANRALDGFVRAGLYPVALAASGRARPISAPFVDLLYDRCEPLASAGGLEVCALRKDPSAAH